MMMQVKRLHHWLPVLQTGNVDEDNHLSASLYDVYTTRIRDWIPTDNTLQLHVDFDFKRK